MSEVTVIGGQHGRDIRRHSPVLPVHVSDVRASIGAVLAADEATACVIDPDLFFPEGSGSAAVAQAEEAIAACQACPRRQACLRHALENGEKLGIWGGWDTSERRRQKALKLRIRAGAVSGDTESKVA
jgi:WhiB family redox-sensing transcriptional regulator